MRLRLLAYLILVASLTTSVEAQTTLTVQDTSSIVVNGKSNQSDWSVTANEFAGSFVVEDDIPVSGSLVITVKEIKSGRSLIMDRLMHGAFNTEEYEEIAFNLDTAELVGEGVWMMSGTLDMTGATNPVQIELVKAEGLSHYSGSYELKMSDYDMKAPTAMFGALITKDDVEIVFDLFLGE